MVDVVVVTKAAGSNYPSAADIASGTPTGSKFLRDDMSWQTPGGGGGIAWREFTLLADAAGVTKTNIGTSFVELSTAGLRSKVDLTGFTDCRIVAGVNKVGTGTQSWKIQYSTDQSSWVDLTPVVDDAATAAERLNVSAWGTIPDLAKADVFIRCVGKSTVAGDDPVVKSVALQIK